MDSHFSHAAFGESLGGISFPLLADFHPKGAVAAQYGLYLETGGITDRATVIIDAGGTVRHISSVTPAGKRDMFDLLEQCRAVDAAYEGSREAFAPSPGLGEDAILYVREPCMFSRWALSARSNLHLDGLTVKNVTQDEAARAELEAQGKTQAPALLVGDDLLYESGDIIDRLVSRCSSI